MGAFFIYPKLGDKPFVTQIWIFGLEPVAQKRANPIGCTRKCNTLSLTTDSLINRTGSPPKTSRWTRPSFSQETYGRQVLLGRNYRDYARVDHCQQRMARDRAERVA